MKKYYGIDLDEVFDDLWHFLEEKQDGTSGHKIVFEGETKEGAAKRASKVFEEFALEKMYEADLEGEKPLIQSYSQACDLFESNNWTERDSVFYKYFGNTIIEASWSDLYSQVIFDCQGKIWQTELNEYILNETILEIMRVENET